MEAWKRRGQTHAAGGNLDSAIDDLKKALNLPGSDEDITSQLGMSYHRQLNFVPAPKYLKRSLREHCERGIPVPASRTTRLGTCVDRC